MDLKSVWTLKLPNFSGNPPTLAVIEWGWVWCEELCKSRRMLSTEPEGWGIRTSQSGEIFWMNNNYNYNGALLARKSGNIKRFRFGSDSIGRAYDRVWHSYSDWKKTAIRSCIQWYTPSISWSKTKVLKGGLYRLTCLTRTHVHYQTRIMQSSHDSMRQFFAFFACNVAILDASWVSEMIFRPTIHTLFKNRLLQFE